MDLLVLLYGALTEYFYARPLPKTNRGFAAEWNVLILPLHPCPARQMRQKLLSEVSEQVVLKNEYDCSVSASRPKTSCRNI